MESSIVCLRSHALFSNAKSHTGGKHPRIRAPNSRAILKDRPGNLKSHRPTRGGAACRLARSAGQRGGIRTQAGARLFHKARRQLATVEQTGAVCVPRHAPAPYRIDLTSPLRHSVVPRLKIRIASSERVEMRILRQRSCGPKTHGSGHSEGFHEFRSSNIHHPNR